MDEQRQARVKNAKKLLQMYPNYSKTAFDMTIYSLVMRPWYIILNPDESVQIEFGAQKTHNACVYVLPSEHGRSRRFCVIFLTKMGPVLQILVPKGRTVTASFYKNEVLSKMKKILHKLPPENWHLLTKHAF